MINVKLHTKHGDDEFEKMRLFCALRHFPELRTSLAVAKQTDIPEPHSRLKSTYVKPKENENFKLGFSNRNAHKVLKNLSTSVLAEVPNPYGPVRSGLRERREEYRQSKMSHKQVYNDLSRPGTAKNRVDHNTATSPTSPTSPTKRYDPIQDEPDPLRRVCMKLARAGISLGHSEMSIEDLTNEELRRELGSSGLLAVLSMPLHLTSAHNTPRSSPRAAHNIDISSQTNTNTELNRGAVAYSVRENSYNSSYLETEEHGPVALLKQRLEVILCIRVDAEELNVLYEAVYLLKI